MRCIGEEFGFEGGCGAFGKCVEDQCSCDTGWAQSTEFSLFLKEKPQDFNETLLQTLPCDANFSILTGLYWFILISYSIIFYMLLLFADFDSL
eukprot:snap_masked-scaffold_7-processed-gene-3.44-mRNA-1 protein AED:1.00 eAED:1.00 QI:0/0/0/0/1/1/2/0/92